MDTEISIENIKRLYIFLDSQIKLLIY